LKSLRNLALALLLVSSLAFGADATRFEKLEQKFVCLCGCNMGPLNMCTMAGCGHSVPMKAEIKQMLDDGKSDAEITTAFVTKYGGVVLSTPTASGFNLSAWIMPFLRWLRAS